MALQRQILSSSLIRNGRRIHISGTGVSSWTTHSLPNYQTGYTLPSRALSQMAFSNTIQIGTVPMLYQPRSLLRKAVLSKVAWIHPKQFLRTSVLACSDSGKNGDKNKSSAFHEPNIHAEEQEREHEFSESHFRDTVDRLDVQNHVSLHQVSSSNLPSTDPNGSPSPPMGDAMSNYVGHQFGSSGSVDLSSVMQSNVPEPFKTSARGSPSHMNMPRGGARQADKYLAGHIKDVHPSRNHSTATILRAASSSNADDNQYAPYADCQGPQESYISVDRLSNMENPCPQGVQGDDCDRFKLWLQNCVRNNDKECDQALLAFRSGRKTLDDIFKEQEQMIDGVARVRKYSTSAGEKAGGDDEDSKPNPRT